MADGRDICGFFATDGDHASSLPRGVLARIISRCVQDQATSFNLPYNYRSRSAKAGNHPDSITATSNKGCGKHESTPVFQGNPLLRVHKRIITVKERRDRLPD